MAALEQLLRRVVDVLVEDLGGRLGGIGGGVAVAEPVDHRDQPAALGGGEHRHVAGAIVPLMCLSRHAALEHQRPPLGHAARALSRSHMTSVTFVPRPGAVSISK